MPYGSLSEIRQVDPVSDPGIEVVVSLRVVCNNMVFPIPIRNNHCCAVGIEGQFICLDSPLSLPRPVSWPLSNGFVLNVAVLELIGKEIVFCVRLVYHWPSPSLKEPSLFDHDPKRLIPDSVRRGIRKDMGQLADWGLAEAYAGDSGFDVAGPAH